ncbi:Oxidoreductase BOA17 [Colletotrichum orbiculare MAFF 240422]|uniref:Oxidoreductase BOA17 n=1 Tax=Colletotrichum orbiculare (strain 104-T / ATCC 96160 / CBS 514.97 / LARS 414 / MAFF 240422) TaxID=1213857 RepID=N4UYK2_COLOR|nr:Oxidoreductase BOA17 [Colletotrichum orbiculare MAFF 240422]
MDSPVWFITGASSGFGVEIAKEALARGHRVIATARNPSKLSALASAGADVMALDVRADEAAVASAVDEAFALHGKITHVVTSAGYALEARRRGGERTGGRRLRFGAVVNFGSLGSWRGGPPPWRCTARPRPPSATSPRACATSSATFGVDVCVVEPGYFRTGFLNPGARILAGGQLDVYGEGPSGEYKELMDSADNNQAGDPVKGSRAVVDVMTSSGPAEGRKIPVRLVLGTDCLAVIRKKCRETLALLDEWEPVSGSTDY